MVAMVVLAVIIVVLAAVVGGVWLIRRRADDEVQSIEGYRHTLSTLGDMRRRRGGTTVRLHGAPPGPAERSDLDQERAAAPDRTGPEAGPPPGRHLAPPTESLGDPEPWGAEEAPPVGAGRAQARAMSAMNHRPRHLVAPILMAIVVVLAAVALAVIGARHKGSSTSTTTVAAPSTTTPGARAGAQTPPSSTTTAPSRFTPVAGASPSAATYVPPTTSYNLTVSATSGNCWVQVQTTANGSNLYAQTVDPGQQASVAVSGTATLQLGSPSSVSIALDNEPVVLPDGFQSPLVLTFQPAGSG
jgi:hypothetical protein